VGDGDDSVALLDGEQRIHEVLFVGMVLAVGVGTER